jgi:predicted metal-dependent hydrolase
LNSLPSQFTYGGETVAYEVVHAEGRRTLSIEVHPDGRVLVRAPLDCPHALVAERVERRAGWISRQLSEFESYRPRTPARQFLSGESHLYLGRQYRLKVQEADVNEVKLMRGQLIVDVSGEASQERVKALLHRWYLNRARAVFGEVLDASLAHFRGVATPHLIVRAMRSRWGSLSAGGRMTLNAQLVRAPRPCIEYVVTHELCHLKHRDHGAQFLRLLGQVMPDWERRKQRLEAALL